MARYLYIANIASPHIAEWVELLGEKDELTIATIEEGEFDAQSKECKYLGSINLPKYLKFLPKEIKYVVLGLKLRLRSRDHEIVHAHNASGYGLVAMLSGRPYLLTTYGSEIYNAPKKSLAYRFILGRCLLSANAVTASTESMRAFLLMQWPALEEKTISFSLGVKKIFSTAPKQENIFNGMDRPIWVSNRRMQPLYRTVELVTAFKNYKDGGGSGALVLLEGDSIMDYKAKVAHASHGRKDIEIVSGFVDSTRIVGLLDDADFSISVPVSDQLSSSILESMSRSCIPILSHLDAYVSVSEACILLNDEGDFVELMEKAFWQAAALNDSQRKSLIENGHEILTNVHSKGRARESYFNLLRARVIG